MTETELLWAVIDIPLQDGATALYWASEKGESLIVKELLESGADPNIQTEASYV